MRHLANARRRALVVDDSADIREVLSALLKDEGWETVEAVNGVHALELLKSDPAFQLLIVDLQMPVMDGWRFCREKNDVPGVAQIPVMLMSASGAERGKTLSATGASRYLMKPFNVSELLRTVEDLVATAGTH